ncbi:flagellar protein [Candidatus Photodesmus katoptron]|uniref:Flagellar protein n=1 Tax=Candidatus Photodesmus katoptron Akat1 TaxID=1236703 RepID=S3EIA0_9GAMM|nr:flagellar biosynthetic protein FliO [Candidatus Photodesmus katoptron]EPE37908.1 flagellar biosynthesis protein FliO [Candidatus Photodesmus katoptron Akat1]KEY90371.1 flagellar protein [Candidatus Photodesmus katoptron]
MQWRILWFILLPFTLLADTDNPLNLIKTFSSLLFIIICILFFAWLLKKTQLPVIMNQKSLSIIQQLNIGTKEKIVIIQAGEEKFLVGITSQSIQLISKLEKSINLEQS